jgi:beta-lactamase class A
MRISLRVVVAIETLAIVLLAAAALALWNEKIHHHDGEQSFPLLSAKVHSNIMEEKSFAIVNFAPLKAKLEDYISEERANMSIYVENLRNGAYTGINERSGFLPASLNKLPLAILIMKKVEEGKLAMDTPIKIQKSDRLNSYGTLYLTDAEELPLHTMLEKLLQESDNTAFSSLLRYVSSGDIEFMLDYYGLDIRLDFPGQELENHSNTLSPKAMSNLFSSLYFSTILTAEHSNYLLSLMETNVYDIKEGAELPESVRVSHKFGEHQFDKESHFHDCGILYMAEKRYFYCIMSKDASVEKARQRTEYVINAIYQYIEWATQQYEKGKESNAT